MDLFERVERMHRTLKPENLWVDVDEFIEFKMGLKYIAHVDPGFSAIFDTIMGHPILPFPGGYIIYFRCDYCGTEEVPEKLDTNWVPWACSKCGGPIRRQG